ncbi:MAG: hypothetical protein HY925_15645 [Elusimicrobia bacterium]|nr:hypothetical protein [Elusimicrobiota bacterium]
MPEDTPKDTEKILDSLTSLDTARMTVRWALERIRFLEQANNEMLDLLRSAREAKDKVLRELDEAKVSADKRLSALTQKERFVGEMQGMLNSLFKGQIDLKDVLEAKAQLEEHKAQVQLEAQTRIHEAETKAKKQEDDFQKRLTELEAGYARSLGEAERRYQEQLQDVQRQRHEESIEGGAREARFKEKLLEEVQKQADQYHQKLALLQFEFSAKRGDLQKEFDELKEKVFGEARHVEMRQADSFRLAKEHWEAERKRLASLVEQREAEIDAAHEQMRAAADKLKEENAVEISRREDDLRALEARLRQEVATELAKREAELRSFEERVRTEAEETREREGRRVEDVNRIIEDERKRHREELANIQASFDSRLALAVQEQLRVREEELEKRLDSSEKHETDFQERLARATQQLQDRIAQIEARATAEVEAARIEARRMLDEQATRHLAELDNARQQGRGVERQLEEALKQERERALKTVESQALKDRETFEVIELELRRELNAAQAEVQRLTDAHTQEIQNSLETRMKLREAFERQLSEELAGHEQAKKALEAHLASREAEWRADHEKRSLELDHEVAERAKRAELAFTERLKALEEENRRMSALRQQEAAEAANRLKIVQDRFDEKLAAEVKGRADLLQKQWEAEKAGVEQRFAGERAEFERRLASEKAGWQKTAEEGLAAADNRYREQLALAQAKAESLGKQAEELSTRAELAERKAAQTPPFPWKRLVFGLAGLAAAGGLGAGGLLFANRGADYKLPDSHPTALVWQGETLWVSDSAGQAIYELVEGDDGMAVRAKHALVGVSPASMALGRDKLFLVDSAAGQIQRRALDKDLTLLGTVASPGPKPSALYYDGQSLWSTDRQTGLLYQHADDETLSVLQSYPIGPDAVAVQSDGTSLWWAEGASRRLTRLGPPPGLAKVESVELPELEASGKPLGAFAWKNDKLWLAVDGEGRVLERPKWRLRKR